MADPPNVKPISDRPANLTALVAEAIQAAIMDRTIAPGERISEASLAAALDVSKTPVREALLRLSQIGIVVPSGRGLRAVTPSHQLIRHAYELRAGAERMAVQLAADRASDDQLSQIARLAATAGDEPCSPRFHTQIAAACRNSLLIGLIKDSEVLTRTLRGPDGCTAASATARSTEHAAIADALLERDAELAGRRIQQHLTSIMMLVLADHGADARAV